MLVFFVFVNPLPKIWPKVPITKINSKRYTLQIIGKPKDLTNLQLKFIEMMLVLQKYYSKLNFREISHLCKIKEFLDVNHIIKEGEKGGIYVRNHIKSTAYL